VQHLRDFERFEMNKCDLGRQRQYHSLVTEEILHEVENQPRTKYWRFANHLTVSQFVDWLRVQNAAQENLQNRGILKFALQTMAGILSN
jgi:erythromycin esterase-like protein